jgi:multiple sugar transport system permease protein
MAGTVVSVVPMVLIFLFAQRYFVQGIALTGLKG